MPAYYTSEVGQLPTPLTLAQTSRFGDVLDSNRAKVIFPPLPGVTNESTLNVSSPSPNDKANEAPQQQPVNPPTGGKALTLAKAELILPQIAQGQVRATLFGGVAAFRGNFVDHQNQFTMAFWENAKGATWQALWGWFQFSLTHRREEYAVDLDVEWYDTKGKPVLPCIIRTVWPVGITPAPTSEESQPVRHMAQFSFDDIEW